MKYKRIIEGIFLERPNRFIAKVLINNKEETAHVKNTGRCKELLISGTKVILEDCSSNPNRKTKYSLISVWKGNMLVNIDSQVPNKVVYDALKDNRVKTLSNLTILKREVTFGNSRFDMYFEKKNQKASLKLKV